MSEPSKPRAPSQARKDAPVARRAGTASTSAAPAASAQPRAAGPLDTANLDEAFVQALETDFRRHGPTAIEAMRAEKPTDYVKLVAAVRARDANDTTHPLREMSDAELVRWIDELAARIGCEIRCVGAGVGAGRVGVAPEKGADAD